jgi:hypothetical protein
MAKSTPALADAVKTAKVSLVAGLKASETEGTPISAKFEIEDGKLQLSVYTSKAGKFFEVVVDHETGKLTKVTPITEGEDLEHATAQADALAKARGSLRDAVTRAEKSNVGYRAVSAVAEIEDGAATADVALFKGSASKNVDEKL